MDTEYWQMEKETINQRFEHILKNNLWTDCKFLVGEEEKEFNAHRLILSISSPVFERMFHGEFTEKISDIKIIDIQPNAFGKLLNYIYTGELELNSLEQACELCYVADKYMMPFLLKYCLRYVIQDVNIANACRCYEFAQLFNEEDLMEKCKTIICKQTSEVLRNKTFLDTQISTVKMILGEKQLNATEYQIFEAIESWCKAEFERLGIEETVNIEKQREIYDQLLPMICFTNMTAAGFAEGPALSQMLKKEDSFAVLMNLTSNSSCPMPKGYSKIIRNTYSGDDENIMLNWPFTQLSKERTYNNMENSICFSCNKDIKLLGLTLVSQDSPKNQILPTKYSEEVEVYVFDWSTNVSHYITYKGLADYNSTLNVLFNEPVPISRGKAYKLGVIMKNAGEYSGGVMESNELVYKSFKFTFTHFYGVLTMRICGIVFKE